MTHTIARRILLETGRGLAVLATAGLLVLGMLGALPASAAEPPSPDGTGVTVLAADAADAQSADEATDAVGTCADLTPTTGGRTPHTSRAMAPSPWSTAAPPGCRASTSPFTAPASPSGPRSWGGPHPR